MAGDLVELVRLAALLPFSWVVPARHWPSLTRVPALLDSVFRRETIEERILHVGKVLGEHSATASPRDIVRDWLAFNYESRMQILRGYRPDRWCPEIELGGLEHLENGIRGGHGVVLWVANFAFSSQITKMALSRAGHAVCHLSRPTHGFSRSAFGIRALNPIQTRIEDRYLGERLTVTQQDGRKVWQMIQEKLGRNGVVSITVGDQAKRIARPRFLAGRIRLATGPAALACRTGAVLLPVFTLRLEPGRFSCRIGPPIEKMPEADDGTCAERMVEEYVSRLQPLVLRHPGLWRNWSLVDVE